MFHRIGYIGFTIGRSMSNQDSALLIFARAPVPGQVKTRLIPMLGDVGACDLYQQLTQQVLAEVIASKKYISYLVCHPDTAHTFFKGLQDRYDVLLAAQQGHDLGDRMLNAISAALIKYKKAIIIGTDCPEYSRAYIDKAFAGLDKNDVVLGPAYDGGYVLIGMKRAIPELFQNKPWGTASVMERTVLSLKKAGLSYEVLPGLHDIDIPSDLALMK